MTPMVPLLMITAMTITLMMSLLMIPTVLLPMTLMVPLLQLMTPMAPLLMTATVLLVTFPKTHTMLLTLVVPAVHAVDSPAAEEQEPLVDKPPEVVATNGEDQAVEDD